MAEQQPLIPQANLEVATQPVRKAVEAEAMKPAVDPMIDIEDVLSGNVTTIGSAEVRPSLVDQANAGDNSAMTKIAQQIDAYNRTQIPSLTQADIPGTKITETGQRVPDVPAELGDEPRLFGMVSSEQEEFKEYSEGRIRLNDAIKKHVIDPRAQELLNAEFRSGEFFTEFVRQTEDFGKDAFFGGYDVFNTYGPQAVSAVARSIMEGTSIAEQWQKVAPDVQERLVRNRVALSNMGFNTSFAKRTNERLKEMYIERYSQEAYDSVYEPTLRDGTKLVTPIINDAAGDALLDYGFDELNLGEKILSFFAPNAAVSAKLGAMTLSKGNRQADRLAEEVAKNPTKYGALDPVDAIRLIEIADRKTAWGKSFRKFQAGIGGFFSRKVGYKGAIGNALEDRAHAEAVRKLNKNITEYDSAINIAEKAKTDGSTIIRIDDGTKNGIELTLDQARTRKSNMENRLTAVTRGAMYTNSPFMATLVSDEAFISAGQALGYEYLGPMMNMDEDSGGAIGALATAFVGRPALKLGKSGIKALGRVTTLDEPLTGFGRFLEDIRLAPRSFFVDRTFDDIGEAIGRTLTPQETRSFQQAARMMGNLTPEGREKVFSAIQNYNDIRGRILKNFEPSDELRAAAANGDQDAIAQLAEKEAIFNQAQNAFTLSFAHASGLAPLQVMEQNAIKSAKGNMKGVLQAVDKQLQAEQYLQMSQLGINQLRRLVEESTGVDPSDRAYLEMFLNGFQDAADGQTMMLAERRREYMRVLSDYKEEVLKDPTAAIEGDTFDRLVELETKLTPNALGNIAAEREILVKNMLDMDNALQVRINEVEKLRGTDEYRVAMGRIAELMSDVRDAKVRRLGKSVYAEADEAMGDEKVDLTPAVTNLLERMGLTKASDYRTYFGSDSDFLRSRSGRFAFKALDDAAYRGLTEGMDLDADDMEELLLRVSTPELRDPTDPTRLIANEDYLGSNPSFIEIALHFSTKQSDEGLTFAPFLATPFEADELSRHMRNKARSMPDDGSARPYSETRDAIEDAIMANPQVATEMLNARSKYKQIIFDPTESRGSLGNRIANAQRKPEFESVGEGYFKRYDEGELPHTWHDPIGQQVGKILSGVDETDSRAALRLEMEDFNRFWSDGRMTVNNRGEWVYDLTIEGNSEKDFENIQKMLSNAIYVSWGDQVRTNVVSKTKLGSLGIAGSPVGGSYDFERIERARNLNQYFSVKVKTGPDTYETRQWFDAEKLISEENDIMKLVQKDTGVREQLADFRRFVNADTGDLADEARTFIELGQRAVRNLEQAAGVTDPLQFYERYVVGYAPGMVDDLRDNFIAGLRASDGEITDTEAQEVFKQGMVYMLTNGMLRRAEVAPVREFSYTALDGTKRQVETLSNAQQLAYDLGDKNTRAILGEFISEKHITFMEDMAEMMLIASGTGIAKYTPGGIRGISPNEMISRAFNIARGMVSPTYVGAEFAFRLLEEQKVSAFEIASESQDGARIMSLLMQDPKLVTDDDVRTFSTLVRSIALREIIRSGQKLSEYIPEDAIEAAMIQRQQETEQ